MNSMHTSLPQDQRGSVKLWVSVALVVIVIAAALVYYLMPEKVQYLKEATEQRMATSEEPAADPYGALYEPANTNTEAPAEAPIAATNTDESTMVTDPAAVTPAATEPNPQPRTTVAQADRGLALVMDDVGYGMDAVDTALGLPAPLTFSILPDAPDAVAAANKAYHAGHIIMLHMPMEPKDPDIADKMMGKTGLTATMNEAQMQRMMEKTLRRIPHVSGVSNHMGSMLTEQADAMRWLMKINRDHGLFFLDSLTTAQSVGRVQAAKAGLVWGSRRFFLDNDRSEQALARMWKTILKRAAKKGGCIVIFHANPKSLAFLQAHIHEADGLLVPLTALLHQPK
ncbi:MAG: divergent polysaccharide deacetylase family protein [Mariprofundaceae bacterium]|nr:divergent polysaccharide deacetylase family protein [Mariprofundaceae bacterium]